MYVSLYDYLSETRLRAWSPFYFDPPRSRLQSSWLDRRWCLRVCPLHPRAPWVGSASDRFVYATGINITD